jgi:hypothetical protein
MAPYLILAHFDGVLKLLDPVSYLTEMSDSPWYTEYDGGHEREHNFYYST